MKTKLVIGLVAIFFLGVASCLLSFNQKNNQKDIITLSESAIQVSLSEVNIGAEGGEATIELDVSNAKVTINDRWISVSDKRPMALVINVDKNLSAENRSSSINITSKNKAMYVTVNQDGDNTLNNEIVSQDENTPNNEIWYTSTNNGIVGPREYKNPENSIVSNTYMDGKGVITFEKDVTFIDNHMFAGCEELKSIIIPNSVTVIGNNAFSRCKGLESVMLSNNITIIAGRAFDGCSALQSINLADNIEAIGQEAFRECIRLKKVNIPDSLTEIYYGTFSDCGLESIDIPSNVTVIEDYAFYQCKFETVVIPDNVTTIGRNAFKFNMTLKEVVIGSGVKEIGEAAFHCDELRTVYCKAVVPPKKLPGESIFDDRPLILYGYEREIFVPSESIDLYNSDRNWGDFYSKQVIKPM